MSLFRLTLSLALPLLLTGCSFHYDLRVVERNGQVQIEPANEQGTGCLSSFSVEIEGGKTVWEIDAGRYVPSPCENRFPITYGVVPAGMTETVPAQSLRSGLLYRVGAWDGDHYSGAFRVVQGSSIENVEDRD